MGVHVHRHSHAACCPTSYVIKASRCYGLCCGGVADLHPLCRLVVMVVVVVVVWRGMVWYGAALNSVSSWAVETRVHRDTFQ